VAGDNVFSFSAKIGSNVAAGAKLVPVVISDGQDRTGNAQVNYAVLAATAPSGIAGATPGTVSATEPFLMTVAVTPGAGPTSTGLAVTADLSSIGASASQAFYDDGTHGDATSGDGTFSFLTAASLGTAPGAKLLPVKVSDAQSRQSSTSI